MRVWKGVIWCPIFSATTVWGFTVLTLSARKGDLLCPVPIFSATNVKSSKVLILSAGADGSYFVPQYLVHPRYGVILCPNI